MPVHQWLFIFVLYCSSKTLWDRRLSFNVFDTRHLSVIYCAWSVFFFLMFSRESTPGDQKQVFDIYIFIRKICILHPVITEAICRQHLFINNWTDLWIHLKCKIVQKFISSMSTDEMKWSCTWGLYCIAEGYLPVVPRHRAQLCRPRWMSRWSSRLSFVCRWRKDYLNNNWQLWARIRPTGSVPAVGTTKEDNRQTWFMSLCLFAARTLSLVRPKFCECQDIRSAAAQC